MPLLFIFLKACITIPPVVNITLAIPVSFVIFIDVPLLLLGGKLGVDTVKRLVIIPFAFFVFKLLTRRRFPKMKILLPLVFFIVILSIGNTQASYEPDLDIDGRSNELYDWSTQDVESTRYFRRRRLFKAHGNWCGPNWTNGMKISAEEYKNRGGSFRAYCIDQADCACRLHDYRCAMHGGCCKSDDYELIDNLHDTDSPWIIAAMRVASYTRDC